MQTEIQACWEPLYYTAGPPKSSFTSLMVTFPSTLFKLKNKEKDSGQTTGGMSADANLQVFRAGKPFIILKMTANNFLPPS